MSPECYVQDATLDDPTGATCAFCNGENTFADDIGWFYIEDPMSSIMRPTCYGCYYGNVGRRHVKKYGQGDR